MEVIPPHSLIRTPASRRLFAQFIDFYADQVSTLLQAVEVKPQAFFQAVGKNKDFRTERSNACNAQLLESLTKKGILG